MSNNFHKLSKYASPLPTEIKGVVNRILLNKARFMQAVKHGAQTSAYFSSSNQLQP
jgi:hypothetical protein